MSMESLLNKVRGSEYDEKENDKVMSRLQWLNHLSMIFNITAGIASVHPSSISITTEAFLNTLIENFQNLPMVQYEIYSKSSSVKCLSFNDIFICFESDFGRMITWDYILEKLLVLENPLQSHKRKHRSENPGSIDLTELVYISKMSSSSVDYDNEPEHRSQRLGDLRIPQTPPGLESYSFHRIAENFTPNPSELYDNGLSRGALRVPDLKDNIRNFMISKAADIYTRLNLSCKKISILTISLPDTLIELNLSHNRLTRFPNLDQVERLEFLNLNWNLLVSLSGTKKPSNLTELYLAHNRITELDQLAQCENLVILDASYNKLAYFQSISALENLQSLRTLNLEGNGITKQPGFKENISTMMPQIVNLNPKNIMSSSKYQSQSEPQSTKRLKNSTNLLQKSESMKPRHKK